MWHHFSRYFWSLRVSSQSSEKGCCDGWETYGSRLLETCQVDGPSGYRALVPSLGWVKDGNWIYILRLLKRVKKKIILQKCSKAIGQFTAFELVCLPVWFSCIYWLHALRQICLDSSQYGQTRRYKTNSVSPTKGASSWGSDGFASFSLNDVAQTGSK